MTKPKFSSVKQQITYKLKILKINVIRKTLAQCVVHIFLQFVIIKSSFF